MSEHSTDSKSPAETKALFSEFPAHRYEEWKAEADRLLKGAPFEKKLLTKTPEGITLQPIYRSEDTQYLPEMNSLPGFAPYLRGGQVWREADKAWQVAQELVYPTYEEFNEAVRHDLKRGQTAVILLLDKASRKGLDPDAAAVGEVGGGGVSIASLKGMTKALDGIKLDETPVYINCGTSALPYLGMFTALATKQGVSFQKLSGALAMDPLGTLLLDGSLPCSIEGALDEMAAMTVWANSKAPQLGTIWVHGEPYAHGGGSAVQELAFVIATAVFYLRELEKREIAPAVVAKHIRFSFALGTHFFMEVAKLRAARLLWNKVTEACSVPEADRSMWIHGRTSRYTKTTFDPYVNMLRTTTEAFSGAVGGAESLHVAPFDEHLRESDEFSRRIARNTQIIIRDEVQLGKILDPAGGSWFVERLTADVAAEAWKLFREIERKGGMDKAVSDGFPQEEIARIAKQRAADVSSRKTVVVGSNQYPNATEALLDSKDVDFAAIHAKRAETLQKLRTSNSHQQEITVLKKLETLMNADRTVMVEAVIDAAGHGATVGEIVRTLPTRKGNPITAAPIKQQRASEAYEMLRMAMMIHRDGSDGGRVFLATLGRIASYMPRFDFAASFFEIGGFEVIRTNGHETPDKAAEAAIASGADVVLICGLDDSYVEGAPTVAKAVKAAKPNSIMVLAGMPEDSVKEKCQKAGVDTFIHVKSDALAVLTDIAKKLGVAL